VSRGRISANKVGDLMAKAIWQRARSFPRSASVSLRLPLIGIQRRESKSICACGR
jgi:hypothetical protein